MRCKPCRDARKGAGRTQREMHDAICASCGKACKVPFQPRSDRPVYCSECFSR
jgi:CxxC-x17-CxxC domain-containing protein